VPNRYCDTLGIPVPRVEEHLPGGVVKLFHTMAVALLERGGPMSLHQVVERLATAGLDTPSGLRVSLLKAWHGREPIVRNPDGSFALAIRSHEMDWILLATGLRPQPKVALPPPPVLPPLRGDDEPFAEDELRLVLQWPYTAISDVRRAAAVLDAAGRPLTGPELDAFASRVLGEPRIGLTRSAHHWRGRMVREGPGGAFALVAGPEELRDLRRKLRGLVRPAAERAAAEANTAARIEAYETAYLARQEREVVEAATLRRAIVRGLPAGAEPEAVGILDVRTREIRIFTPAERAAVVAALGEYDLLAGLDMRGLLLALGADPDRWEIADLGPPQKTWRLNRAGRTLRLTPELLMSGSLGISRPLADAAKVRGYVASGDRRRLAARLESDLKHLHAFYRYGTLHGCVRLRWGFVDAMLYVPWCHPGDPQLDDILREAVARGLPVDLVVGSAPGWEHPWARARRVYVEARDDGWLYVDGRPEDPPVILAAEVQALRLAEGDEEA